ncbi:TPA: acyltransferase family protein [Klebsiella pneumoniae]|nr:acyltransferase family protein [Klebsiella pneumoniae]
MNNRLTGLDLLRSIIMIFGPTFHASMLYGGAWGFDYSLNQNVWVVDALNLTHPFRMELFFIISGFFSALLIKRKGASHFISSRKKRLIRPTLLAVMIILPLIAMEMYFLFDDKDLRDYLSYKHLWFLIVLSQISMLLMLAPEKINRLASYIAEKLNRLTWPFVFSLLFLAVCLSVAVSKIVNMLLPNSVLSVSQIIPTIQYIPFFFTGMLLFFIKKDVNKKEAMFLSALYLLWYFFSIIFKGEFKTAMSLCQVFAVIALCLALFYTFKNLNIKENKTITALSKLALPFYLTHLPILIFLGWVWSKSGISRDPVLFLTYVIVLNIIFSFAASILIRKSQKMSIFLGLA